MQINKTPTNTNKQDTHGIEVSGCIVVGVWIILRFASQHQTPVHDSDPHRRINLKSCLDQPMAFKMNLTDGCALSAVLAQLVEEINKTPTI